jgi:pimeloyl-ACP methyl ester carboxylesterase
MPSLDSDGVRIAYDDIGTGPPVVLVHGFASNRTRNWKDVRWFDTLVNAGRRVIALDCRGHGESDKPYDPAAYSADVMTGDVVRLLDHLRVREADIMGYSMGARLTAAVLARFPERCGRGILGGVGGSFVGERSDAEMIARVLEVADPGRITHPAGRAFRRFAEQGRNDLRALAACMRGLRSTIEADELTAIRLPVLIVVGERDDQIGDPQDLAALIPGAQLVVIPGRDHLSTVGDPRYKQAVLEFLA